MYPVTSHRFLVGSKPSISASVPMTTLPPSFGVPTGATVLAGVVTTVDDEPPPPGEWLPLLHDAAIKPVVSSATATRTRTCMSFPLEPVGAKRRARLPTVPSVSFERSTRRRDGAHAGGQPRTRPRPPGGSGALDLPVAAHDPPGDDPSVCVAGELVVVPHADDEVVGVAGAGWRRRPVERDRVGLERRPVTLHGHELVGHHVHGARPPLDRGPQLGEVVVDRAGRARPVDERVPAEARPHELPVPAVHTAGVPQRHVGHVRPVPQLAHHVLWPGHRGDCRRLRSAPCDGDAMTGTSERLVLPCGDVMLVADAWGDPAAPPVLLLHGGGQTRHAWGGAARAIAAKGWRAVAVDLRGHGDSGWSPDGVYGLEPFVTDVRYLANDLAE